MFLFFGTSFSDGLSTDPQLSIPSVSRAQVAIINSNLCFDNRIL